MNVMLSPDEIQSLYAIDNFVYFDIETIPSQDPAYHAEVEKNITAPSRYTKPESIAKWVEENGEDAFAEAIAKTSFDGARGHVCTISWAKNGGLIKSAHASTVEEEKGVLEAFFDALDDYHHETLVGHNIASFDIPFLTKRAIALGVKLPPNTSFPRDPKPWSKNVHDTMVMWAGAKGRISMDKLCGVLGVPGKADFDGSMVAAAWANGEHEKIARYCADDVARTRALHQRFLVAGW